MQLKPVLLAESILKRIPASYLAYILFKFSDIETLP